MKNLILVAMVLGLNSIANAGAMVSAGGDEELILSCESPAYQLSVVSVVESGREHFYMAVVSNPNSDPAPVGKYEVSPLPSTGFEAAWASHSPQIYVTAQYNGSIVRSVQIKQFANLKNLPIDCK